MKIQYAYNEEEHTLHLIRPTEPDLLHIIPFVLSQSPESALEVVRALNRGDVLLQTALQSDLFKSDGSCCVVWGGAYFNEDCVR